MARYVISCRWRGACAAAVADESDNVHVDDKAIACSQLTGANYLKLAEFLRSVASY